MLGQDPRQGVTEPGRRPAHSPASLATRGSMLAASAAWWTASPAGVDEKLTEVDAEPEDGDEGGYGREPGNVHTCCIGKTGVEPSVSGWVAFAWACSSTRKAPDLVWSGA